MENRVTFKDKGGNSLTGQNIKVPGYELLDLVFIQDGFFCKVYELATGVELINAKGFSVSDATKDVVLELAKKKYSDQRLLDKIYSNQYKGANALFEVINQSPAYIRYVQAKEYEKANRPLFYTEEERAEIKKLIAIGEVEGLPNMDIYWAHYNKQVNPASKEIKNLTGVIEAFFRQRNRHYAQEIRFKGEIMPEHLRYCDDWQPTEVTWDNMIEAFNEMRKRDITRYIPSDLLNEYALLWDMAKTKNNAYGYTRFLPHGMTSLIRLQIDLRAGRDVTQDIIDVQKEMREAYAAIESETQPYVRRAHEVEYKKV